MFKCLSHEYTRERQECTCFLEKYKAQIERKGAAWDDGHTGEFTGQTNHTLYTDVFRFFTSQKRQGNKGQKEKKQPQL